VDCSSGQESVRFTPRRRRRAEMFPPSKNGPGRRVWSSPDCVPGTGLFVPTFGPAYLLAPYGPSRRQLVYGIAFTLVGMRPGPTSYQSPAPAARSNGLLSLKLPQLPSPTCCATQALTFSGSLLILLPAGAGLMVIISISGWPGKHGRTLHSVAVRGHGDRQCGWSVVAGCFRNKIGRRLDLRLVLFAQALLMFAAFRDQHERSAPWIIVLVATLIGFNDGPSFHFSLRLQRSMGP